MDFEEFVGLPFAERGRGPNEYDCWGLLALVYRERFSVELPSFSESYTTTEDRKQIAALIEGNLPDDWKEISPGSERIGDGVLMSLAGHPRHVGIVVAPGLVLHTERRSGSLIESYHSLRLRPRVMGFYRYEKKPE